MRVLLYAICSLFIWILSFGVNRKKKLSDWALILVICCVPAIFSVMLPYASSDRSVYADRFINFYPAGYMNNWLAIFKQTSIEYGFIFYNLIIYKIFHSVEAFFFLSAFLPNLCLMWCFYQTREFKFNNLVLIYLVTWYPMLSFYSIRQMLAMGFVFIGMTIYLQSSTLKSCWKKVFFWMVVAMLFHGTAIIVVVWLFLCEICVGKGSIKLLAISLSVGVVLMWPILNWVLSWEIFENKFLGSRDVESLSIVVFAKGLPMLLAALLGYLYRNRLYAKDCRIDKYIIGCLLFGFMYVYAIDSYWVFRLSFYGILLFCILLACIRRWIIEQPFAKYMYLLTILVSAIIFYRELILYMTLVFV